MKYLKLFEELNINKPQVGDYVICKLNYGSRLYQINKKIGDKIGKIETIDKSTYPYSVKYGIPIFGENDYFVSVGDDEIIEFSKNKEDLEIIINANKYNL